MIASRNRELPPFLVEVPPGRQAERRYIVSTLFEDFLGLSAEVRVADRTNTRVTLEGPGELFLPDGFFQTPDKDWLTARSLPKPPLPLWKPADHGFTDCTVEPTLPILFATPGPAAEFNATPEQIRLPVDVFGTAFFFLTRYEEALDAPLDAHQRFTAEASVSTALELIDRPLVNEYLELLWACLRRLWPALRRRERHFRVEPSHDVDAPSKYGPWSAALLSRKLVGDLLRRRSPGTALKRTVSWARVKLGDRQADPFETFDLLMSSSEQRGLTSTFYFLADRRHALDGHYQLDEPAIRRLLGRIHVRGHRIGLHGSYTTFHDPEQLGRELHRLRAICAQEGIRRETWGARQHYLRFRVPETWRHLSDAGVDYDSTLSFADHAGFRCGVCYEYPVFDLVERRTLPLRERPLIVMECSVIDERYMAAGLEGTRAGDLIERYRERCRQFNGTFTLLWHNSRLEDPRERQLYERSLGG